SQCPSIVTAQLAYFFSMAALSFSACCPADVSSSLSYSKKTGLSGEFLFRSSSDADPMLSSRTGSGGTFAGNRSGSGGRGGGGAEEVGMGAVDGGRATGGLFL